eukprot:CAMPEP_0197633012 /NCGR_PEP_ID=MMETSP1338-20131121/9484_1 /TAXON_ID=43686 ORGANISM="Pelagodinium beii, Strain RCC1491" /NCGR_SAMPLE_ID=MMETSP1338 /ASSEMBLY_ACC=CAM_ASM_000754 /LENGTH=882 /DNA_ID=CAMNT_0043204595 /DNA_START=1 /DNA_END=2649 /DNA_ORIENTATION=-
MSHDLAGDPIVKALEKSTIAQTLKAARASLAEPSRPFTPLDRSLFQRPSEGGDSRPTSSYGVDQLAFVRDTFGNSGGRPESARSSRSSRTRPDTIQEEDDDRHQGAEVLRLDEEVSSRTRRRPSPQESPSEAADTSGSEELTPVTAAPAPPSTRAPMRPPRPPGTGGYPGSMANLRSSPGVGGYPDPIGVADSSPRRASPRRWVPDGSPMEQRRKASQSPSPSPGSRAASSDASPIADIPVGSASCEVLIAKLQSFAASKEKRKKNAELLSDICERLWEISVDMKAGRGGDLHLAPQLLREVMGLMDIKDLKDAKCIFKIARCALSLLSLEAATKGVPVSGVSAAYQNISQVLFKYSQKEGHDQDFLTERIIEPLIEVLESDSQVCCSPDLRVYIVGVLKNVSNDTSNQKFLAQRGAVSSLFRLMDSKQLTGSSKESQLLIQVTAALRNLASQQYKQFIQAERLDSLTRVMAVFPGHTELLTNIARILAKLTLHGSAVEALAKNDAHIRQIAKTLSSNAESTPLTLRLAFVLGNLTERSDRLRVVFAFDCEGTSLVPQLLTKYWQKDRQLARLELEKDQSKASGLQEIEEVLVKLSRLLANIAISQSAGVTLASSSAVVDPLLDMLGAKRIGDSEELVLNVVAAVTNLLFYDVPSNLLFQEDNKQLLCRLFRPLLLESYNVEALVETARALGNLSRHADARRCMVGLRLDEILVILLDHDDRDLVFYSCGALVNFAADPDCTPRLTSACPAVQKLAKLLGDAPSDDPALQLVAVKVLTNLSLDPGAAWPATDVEAVRETVEQTIGDCEELASEEVERQQLLDLARHLQSRLPVTTAVEVTETAREEEESVQMQCMAPGCGRTFNSKEKLDAHVERRHSKTGN